MSHRRATAALSLLLAAVMWWIPSVAASQPSEDFNPPRIERQTQPEYPPKALEAGLGASVVLLIDIDTEGRVEKVEVANPITGPAAGMGFETAALEVAKQWQFKPATEAGTPVAVQISFTLHFKPPKDNPKPSGDDKTNPPPLNFTGEVLERGTRTPLSGILITVFRGEGDNTQGFETTTDAEGRFAFAGLSPDTWRVHVEPDGYYPLRTEEDVLDTGRLEVVYRLERASYNRFDVIVEGTIDKSKVTRRQITTEEMALMPGIYGDPLKVIRTLPGVAQTNTFTSDIVIRGGDPEDTRFYAMGLRVPAAFHFGGLRGLFPEGMVDRLILYPGGFPVYYGRSTGGIIDIVLPQRAGDRTRGYVDLSLLDTTLAIEIPITKDLWIAGSARRSYFDTIAAGVGLIVGEQQILPRYGDIHLQISWRPTPDHDLTFFTFIADDDFVRYSSKDDGQNTKGDLPESSMLQVGATHRWTPGPQFEWTTAMLVGGDRVFELTTLNGLAFAPAGFLGFQIEARSLRVAGRSDVSIQLGDAIRMQAGLDGVWSDVGLTIKADPNNETLDGDGNPVTPEGLDPKTGQAFAELAGFLELALSWPGTGLSIIPGARVDHFGQVDATTFDPRLRLQYDPHPDWTLRSAVGLMHQAPRTAEINLDRSGVPLVPERVLQTSAGATWRPIEALEIETLGFIKRGDKLVVLEDELQLLWRNSGRGLVYGLEALIRWPLRGRFNGWLAYTLSRSERFNPVTGEDELAIFDQTHNLTVFGSWRFPRNWTFGARYSHATGFPAFSEDGRIVGRTDHFHQVDVRLDKTWIYDNWTLLAYLDIQNVTNEKFPTDIEVSGERNPAEPRAVSPGFPLIPILGVKGEF